MPYFYTIFSFWTVESQETLDAMGFSQMTPVQAAAIPLFMKNKDVVVEVCGVNVVVYDAVAR